MYMYMQNMYMEKSAQHFTICHYPGTIFLIVPSLGINVTHVVIKSRGPGILPGYFYWKIEEK